LEAADCKLKGAGKKKELKGDLTRKQKYQGITSIAEKIIAEIMAGLETTITR